MTGQEFLKRRIAMIDAEEKGRRRGYVEAMALELHNCREKVGELQLEITRLATENNALKQQIKEQ